MKLIVALLCMAVAVSASSLPRERRGLYIGNHAPVVYHQPVAYHHPVAYHQPLAYQQPLVYAPSYGSYHSYAAVPHHHVHHVAVAHHAPLAVAHPVTLKLKVKRPKVHHAVYLH